MISMKQIYVICMMAYVAVSGQSLEELLPSVPPECKAICSKPTMSAEAAVIVNNLLAPTGFSYAECGAAVCTPPTSEALLTLLAEQLIQLSPMPEAAKLAIIEAIKAVKVGWCVSNTPATFEDVWTPFTLNTDADAERPKDGRQLQDAPDCEAFAQQIFDALTGQGTPTPTDGQGTPAPTSDASRLHPGFIGLLLLIGAFILFV